MTTKPTPFQELIQILHRWYEPQAKEQDVQRIRELMQQIDINNSKEKDRDSYGLISILGSQKIPRDLLNELVDFLVKKSDNPQTTYNYGGLLHVCIQRNEKEFFDKFLELGVNVRSLDITRQNPLHVAADYNRPEFVTSLLSRDDAHTFINAQDIDKKTPLHLAVAKNYATCVKLLLDHPAINLNLKDKQGRTPQQLINPNQTDPAIIRAFQEKSRNNRSQRWQPAKPTQTDYLSTLRHRKQGYQPLPQAEVEVKQPQREETGLSNWLRNIFSM